MPLELSARLPTGATSWLDASWSMGWLRDFFLHVRPAAPSAPIRT